MWAQLIPCSISTLVLKLNYKGEEPKNVGASRRNLFVNIFFGHTLLSHICLANQWKVQIPIFVSQYPTFCMLVFIFVILSASKRQLGVTRVTIYWDFSRGKHSAKRNSATKKCLKTKTFAKCQCVISAMGSSCWTAAIWTSDFSFSFRFHNSVESPAVQRLRVFQWWSAADLHHGNAITTGVCNRCVSSQLLLTVYALSGNESSNILGTGEPRRWCWWW